MNTFSRKQKLGDRLDQYPLLQSAPWTIGWLLAAGVALSVLSLLYAFGSYSWNIFFSYFTHPVIAVLNILPVVFLLFLLYFLTGRPKMAYLITAIVVLSFSFGNYYMLRLRDDPLMFGDFLNLKEGMAISAKQGYDLTPDRRMIFGVLCVVAGNYFFKFFVRRRKKTTFVRRLLPVILTAGLLAGSYFACDSHGIYNVYAVNDSVNNLAATQTYISRGFIYPFLHSISANTLKKPEGYTASAAQAILEQYQNEDIPEDRRVNVVVLQLEAFSDFSAFTNVEGIDWKAAYGTYHQILQESYHGKLLVNIFAGGTVNTERGVLTGFSHLKNFRANTNSYAWYFDDQNYDVGGSHPSYQWFYNRKNINNYLGLPNYYFYEDYYGKFSGDAIAGDNILFPEVFKLYQSSAAQGKPVFSFNVTYQGHGPYDTTYAWRGKHYTDGRYSRAITNILDNYLSSVEDTAEQLKLLLDDFAQEKDPVVVVIYGDHKPWMGDDNALATELDINLDTATEEGLYNKYSTEYVFWANDAAKAVTGSAFTGEGPTLSPNYVMNELFALCGWKGNAYMQAMDDLRTHLSAITTVGRYIYDGELMTTASLTDEAKAAVEKFDLLEYYWETKFAG